MRIAGIIAEYDPFHKGHAAHIAATRAKNGANATHVIAVISGSFTQRGEPALLSKFCRAEMALSCGADLVLELPLPWAMAPAENFANGGVAILNSLNCVDVLSFGSECGDIASLEKIAALSNDSEYQAKLRCALSEGIPYAAAVQAAAGHIIGPDTAAILSSPNNTLAIEYLRATNHQGAKWDTFTLQRQGALHTDTLPKNGYASATLLRHLVRSGDNARAADYMPAASASLLNEAVQIGQLTTNTKALEQALLAQLRRIHATNLAQLPWLSEGLENRLYQFGRSSTDYTTLLERIKTKRYPMARIKRVLWSALLGLTSDDIGGLPPYIRVLGMNDRGKEILSVAKTSLPLITRATQIDDLDERAKRIFALECTATNLHALAMATPLPCGTDYTTKMILK